MPAALFFLICAMLHCSWRGTQKLATKKSNNTKKRVYTGYTEHVWKVRAVPMRSTLKADDMSKMHPLHRPGFLRCVVAQKPFCRIAKLTELTKGVLCETWRQLCGASTVRWLVTERCSIRVWIIADCDNDLADHACQNSRSHTLLTEQNCLSG